MSQESEGRIAVITGGAGALGRAVVRRFLESGHVVHVPVYKEDEGNDLKSFLGDGFGDVLHLTSADLSSAEGVGDFFRAVETASGRGPDVLCNLAGGFAMGALEETDAGTWDRMMGMNASSAFHSTRAALPGMVERGWGRVVSVTAFPALERGAEEMSAYAASKAAVLNLTHSLAKEFSGTGVAVNAIAPRIIDTPANREAMPDADFESWPKPAEIAEVIHFLASEAATVVTGAVVPIDRA